MDYKNIAFEKKYLKYKLKYLQLKNEIEQVGGAETFCIYTTGMMDWGNTETIIYKWIAHNILSSILDQIPEKYTNVEIHHYDNYFQLDDIAVIELKNSDEEKPRIRLSMLHKEDLEPVILRAHDGKNYIVIDFANECYKMYPPINFVNIVYLGDDSLSGENRDYYEFLVPVKFAKEHLFNVNEDGTITTYLQKMYESGFLTGERSMENPIGDFVYIFKNIKNALQITWTDKTGKRPFPQLFEKLAVSPILNNGIEKLFLDLVWAGYTSAQMHKYIYDILYNEIFGVPAMGVDMLGGGKSDELLQLEELFALSDDPEEKKILAELIRAMSLENAKMNAAAPRVEPARAVAAPRVEPARAVAAAQPIPGSVANKIKKIRNMEESRKLVKTMSTDIIEDRRRLNRDREYARAANHEVALSFANKAYAEKIGAEEARRKAEEDAMLQNMYQKWQAGYYEE